MDERERINALDVALNNELNEHKFYMKNAERTTNPLGKAMFKQIGKEEMEHHERLKQLHDEWTRSGKWPNTLPLKVRGTEIKSALSEFANRAESTAPSESDDLAAIKTAIDFESKGMEYYASLRDSITDKKESEFFGLLSSIERGHYLSLKDAEEYFIDPAGWYRSHEHPSLE